MANRVELKFIFCFGLVFSKHLKDPPVHLFQRLFFMWLSLDTNLTVDSTFMEQDLRFSPCVQYYGSDFASLVAWDTCTSRACLHSSNRTGVQMLLVNQSRRNKNSFEGYHSSWLTLRRVGKNCKDN